MEPPGKRIKVDDGGTRGLLNCISLHLSLMCSDSAKLKFVREAMCTQYKFETNVTVSDDIDSALTWVIERSADKVST